MFACQAKCQGFDLPRPLHHFPISTLERNDMSYKFEFKGKKYWIKETSDKTEIHYNIGKGCSDIYVMDSSAGESLDKIMVLVDKLNDNK